MDILMTTEGVSLSKGKLSLTKSRGESLAQRLVVHLRTFLESWFLDVNMGIDYFNKVFEKTIPKSSIDATFQTAIYKDVRVEKIIAFNSTIERNKYRLSFKVKAKEGFISDVVNVDISNNEISIGVGA
ncbi:baseplate wedge subunit [Acinetobacter phage vB_AbaM_KissB]|uniref:hypothetical protein n=1 Tax=Acinetobacter phage vB_AbaM_phiAbaA1 TaxID=1605379 RepID=UPI00078CE058|nr:hypothetical protein BJD49_gp138 [Acinetobacter phage vB_AbaM_phiAbaA1]AJK27152.1 hypothetical protein phiAbaA1_049 [Acinetobacter phage vB_AbaM_phiAbaA1]